MSFGADRLEPLFRIGLGPLDLADWFEIDDTLDHYRAEKDRLSASEGSAVFREEAGTEAAQAEVLSLVRENLAQHHRDVVLPAPQGGSDLLEAARLVQDDLLLLRQTEQGWRLVAGALHFPSSWSLAEKFGLPLDQIHGNVPQFGPGTRNAGLMARIFDALKVEQPTQRMNWSLYPTAQLYHPFTAFGRAAHPDRHRLDAASFIRVERQTLRKLPATGDILFGVRIYLDPLSKLAQHPGMLAKLRGLLLELTPEERDYKGLRGTFDEVVQVIETMEQGQP